MADEEPEQPQIDLTRWLPKSFQAISIYSATIILFTDNENNIRLLSYVGEEPPSTKTDAKRYTLRNAVLANGKDPVKARSGGVSLAWWPVYTDNTKKDVKEIKLRLFYIEHGEEDSIQYVRELSSTIPFADLKAAEPLEQTWYRGDDASSGSAFDKKNYSAGHFSPISATFDSSAGMIKVFVQERKVTGRNLTVIYTKDLKSAKDAKWENRRAAASFLFPNASFLMYSYCPRRYS